MAKQKLENITPFGLRMQPDLKAAMEKSAKTNRRSLNAEITERLAESLALKRELRNYSDGELIDELILRWGRNAVFIKLGKEDPT